MLEPALRQYRNEHRFLSQQETEEHVRCWEEVCTRLCFSSRMNAIFLHTYLRLCGDQISAKVHGCLDSGAD